MLVTFRWKLFGSYILLIAMMATTIYGYLQYQLNRQVVSGLQETLLNEARLAALLIAPHGDQLRSEAPRLAVGIGKTLKTRVTIINIAGDVLGDSEVKPEALKTLENHHDRPEILAALGKEQGSAIRYSTTLQTDMLYGAVPIISQAKVVGILRLALPLTAVNRAEGSFHSLLAACLAMAFGLALMFSYILSRITSRPLRQVAMVADEIGKGNFSRRLPAHRRDEFGNLSRVMNVMSARIEEQLGSLANERNRLDAIVRGMGEGLMVADALGAITMVNPAFCTLFDVSDNVVGRPLMAIARHPALHESFNLVIQTRAEHQDEIIVQMAMEKTIRIHWVPLLKGNDFLGLVAVFHDISDLKRLEKVRRDFVANVSHELRTPITVIKGYAETLQAGIITEDPTRALRFVEIILNHSERLATLIKDLLSLSEMESGELPLELLPHDLEGTVRRAFALLEAKVAVKSMKIDMSGMKGMPPVLVDQGRIEQVFVNLIDNAIKYTPVGGEIVVSAEVKTDSLIICVKDNGPGIPPQSLPRLFERFYRVDAGRSRDEGGTGLGLSIVKHIIQLHGGKIWVESPVGNGTSFFFSLKKASV